MSTINTEVAKKHFFEIFSAHPDAYKIAASNEFLHWVQRQPPMVQEAVQSGAAADVIEVLNWYKAARKQPKFTRAQIEAMTQQEFVRREKEIDEAMRRGEIT